MNTAFLVLLFLTSGIVLALFLTLPYGRFVHGIYRFLALVHNAREARHMSESGTGV